MSKKLNLNSNDLYLGKQEMSRLQEWILEHFTDIFTSMFNEGGGYIDNPANKFSLGVGGISNGTTVAYVKINKGRVVDNNMKVIDIIEQDDYYQLTTPSVPYYFFVDDLDENWEEGTVSIDINGNLSGTGTLFTEAMRGQPDFQSMISFNSSNNTSEYAVLTVTNDTTAQVSGASFVAESGIKYRVVGTFTPTTTPSASDKYPFVFTRYSLTVQENNATPPTSDSVLLGIANWDGASTITFTDGDILTIDDKLMDANVPLKDGDNSFNGDFNEFSGNEFIMSVVDFYLDSKSTVRGLFRLSQNEGSIKFGKGSVSMSGEGVEFGNVNKNNMFDIAGNGSELNDIFHTGAGGDVSEWPNVLIMRVTTQNIQLGSTGSGSILLSEQVRKAYGNKMTIPVGGWFMLIRILDTELTPAGNDYQYYAVPLTPPIEQLPVIFIASNSSSVGYSVTSGGNVIAWNNIQLDSHTGWDGSDTWTAPFTGYYKITAHLKLNGVSVSDADILDVNLSLSGGSPTFNVPMIREIIGASDGALKRDVNFSYASYIEEGTDVKLIFFMEGVETYSFGLASYSNIIIEKIQ